MVVLVAALATTTAEAYKEADLISALLSEARSNAYEQRDADATLDDMAELGANLVKAFAPIMRSNATERQIPSLKLMSFEAGEAEGEAEGTSTRNLQQLFASQRFAHKIVQNTIDSGVPQAMAAATHKLIAKVLDNWPIWVDGIWMRKFNTLGGGTCSFYFESKKNYKYLPLLWKLVDAQCRRFNKSSLNLRSGSLGNNFCVKFKLFNEVDFTHCAPSAYWQALVRGDIISVNPTNGATVIDAFTLLQTGGLDQFLPLRAALGQGGLLDILNYL